MKSLSNWTHPDAHSPAPNPNPNPKPKPTPNRYAQENANYAHFLRALAAYKKEIGFTGQLLLEPYPYPYPSPQPSPSPSPSPSPDP